MGWCWQAAEHPHSCLLAVRGVLNLNKTIPPNPSLLSWLSQYQSGHPMDMMVVVERTLLNLFQEPGWLWVRPRDFSGLSEISSSSNRGGTNTAEESSLMQHPVAGGGLAAPCAQCYSLV